MACYHLGCFMQHGQHKTEVLRFGCCEDKSLCGNGNAQRSNICLVLKKEKEAEVAHRYLKQQL